MRKRSGGGALMISDRVISGVCKLGVFQVTVMRIIITTSRALVCTSGDINIYVLLTDNFGSCAGGARFDKDRQSVCQIHSHALRALQIDLTHLTAHTNQSQYSRRHYISRQAYPVLLDVAVGRRWHSPLRICTHHNHGLAIFFYSLES
jgi:hypothetical protein